MGGERCAALWCPNTSKPVCKQNRPILHRFPVNDPKRCRIWKAFALNPRLVELDDKRIYKQYRLCGNHFTQSCYLRPLSKLLFHTATPNVEDERRDAYISQNSTSCASFISHLVEQQPEPDISWIAAVCDIENHEISPEICTAVLDSDERLHLTYAEETLKPCVENTYDFPLADVIRNGVHDHDYTGCLTNVEEEPRSSFNQSRATQSNVVDLWFCTANLTAIRSLRSTLSSDDDESSDADSRSTAADGLGVSEESQADELDVLEDTVAYHSNWNGELGSSDIGPKTIEAPVSTVGVAHDFGAISKTPSNDLDVSTEGVNILVVLDDAYTEEFVSTDTHQEAVGDDNSVSKCTLSKISFRSGDLTVKTTEVVPADVVPVKPALTEVQLEEMVDTIEEVITRGQMESIENSTLGLYVELHCCPCCRFTSVDKEEVVRHTGEHSSASICEMCGCCVENGKEHLISHVFRVKKCNKCSCILPSNRSHSHPKFCPGLFPHSDKYRIKPLLDRFVYACLLCPKAYSQFSVILMHLKRSHLKLYDHVCTLCGKGFFVQFAFKQHMLSHGLSESFQCDECGQRFKTRVAYRKHARHHNPPAFNCDVCGKGFFTNARLKEHHTVHTGELPFPCRFCAKSFRVRRNRNQHEALRHRTRSDLKQCAYCHKQFVSDVNLVAHENRCAMNKDGVVKELSFVDETTVHYAIKHRAVLIETICCVFCLFDHADPSRVREHMAATHTDINDSRICALCDRGFTVDDSIVDHLCANHLPKCVKCCECGWTAVAAPYVRHYFCRRELKPAYGSRYVAYRDGQGVVYCCLTCRLKVREWTTENVSSVNQNPLHKHFRKCLGATRVTIWEGGAPAAIAPSVPVKRHIKQRRKKGEVRDLSEFVCTVCGAQKWSRANLVSHMYSHTGEKPFKCKVCGRAFAQSSHVRSHNLTHTGEKPYSCDVCGKSFALIDNCRKHRMTHGSDRPHKCPVCRKGYICKRDLRRHSSNHNH